MRDSIPWKRFLFFVCILAGWQILATIIGYSMQDGVTDNNNNNSTSQVQVAQTNNKQKAVNAASTKNYTSKANKALVENNTQHHITISSSISPSTYLPTSTASNMDYDVMELSISPDAHTIGEVAPEYISTTLDWWMLGTEAWGNSSILNANLAHPNLLTAAKGLSPFFLRIGGSQADNIIYNMIPHKPNDDISNLSTTEIQCKKKPLKCLTKERWDEVLKFANQVGARIVFTLAYVKHTRGDEYDEKTNDQKDWDSSNARHFMEYIANSPYANLVYGFELGNEVRHKGKVKNITRLVNAYKELGQIVDGIWSTDERKHNKPIIAGPAATGKKESAKLIKATGQYLQLATYHKYHGGGKDPDLQPPYNHPVELSGPGEAVKEYMPKGSKLWIGEGAMAYNSGKQNITDSFHGSLWFANVLGSLAKTKPVAHSVYCRQALLGGYYELISHQTLIPNPDYWLAYLWKQLVGTKAVGPILSPQRKDSLKTSNTFTFGCCYKPGRDFLLIHSFCSAKLNGDVVLIVINKSESKAMNLDIQMGETRTEYLLTPNEDGLKSRQMLLNGEVMSIENNTLPVIDELGIRREREEQLNMPPISIAFIVVHGGEVEVCLR